MSKQLNNLKIKYKVSYKKLWKLLIDRGLQKKIYKLNAILVLLPLLS